MGFREAECDELGACRSLMLYDDVPTLEVGVEIARSFAPVSRVAPSVGCDRLGLQRLGPRWGIYGHDAPGDEAVEIAYLVR